LPQQGGFHGWRVDEPSATGFQEGDFYFNTVTFKWRVIHNNAWQDIVGAPGTVTFSKGGVLIQPTVQNVLVWRAPFSATVTAVKAYQDVGTGSIINARRNFSLNLLASNYTITSADVWQDGGTVQNTAVSSGDSLEIMFVSVSGSPNKVGIQVDMTSP